MSALTETSGVRRAWGWVAHLRAGGTTAWQDWSGEQAGGSRLLPGAQQLELLRRLNRAGSPSADLAERVLGASAPGRGRPDLELAGAVERLRFGPPPVDPADLPDDELVRVAVGLVADDVVAAGTPPPPEPGLLRPWRRRYRLVGDPWLADPVRAHLVQRGRPPGGRGVVVLVLGTDLPTMLADAWTARAFSEGGPDWRSWLDIWVQRQQPAPRADLVTMARHWAGQVGREHVELVLDPAALPRLVGVRRGLPAPLRVSAEGADLARRVASVLGLLVTPGRREELLTRTLLPRLAGVPGTPLAVPAEHEEWVRRRAGRMRDALLTDGYAVHGDPGSLLPGHPGPSGRPTSVSSGGTADPSEAAVLDLAVRLLLDAPTAGRPGHEEEPR